MPAPKPLLRGRRAADRLDQPVVAATAADRRVDVLLRPDELEGGRYDGLVEAIGGPPTPGIGFGAGIERLLLAIERKSARSPRVAVFADSASSAALAVTAELHRALRRRLPPRRATVVIARRGGRRGRQAATS